MKKKIALFCDVDARAVINNETCSTIYEVPLLLQEEGLDRIVLEKLGLEDRHCDMDEWTAMAVSYTHLLRGPRSSGFR